MGSVISGVENHLDLRLCGSWIQGVKILFLEHGIVHPVLLLCMLQP